MTTNLSDRLDPRRNSLNFLRLVLATLVIVSHMWPIGGYGRDPQFADVTFGHWAVLGFFAISGYLIAKSRLKSDFAEFLKRRALRIYPGYLVCIVLVAFAFAPLSTLIDHSTMSWRNAGRYVIANLFLKNEQTGVKDTLQAVPYPNAWDGSLWTLFFEFVCYLAIGILLWREKSRVSATIIAFLACAVGDIILTHGLHESNTTLEEFTSLGGVFFAGSLLALYANRIRMDYWLAIAAAGAGIIAAELGVVSSIGAIPIAYLCLWAGATLPFVGVGRKNDISYGLYTYAFPVQQFLVLLKVNRLPVGGAVIVAVACTVPFAAGSWFLVERPAIRLKNRPRAAPARHAVAARTR